MIQNLSDITLLIDGVIFQLQNGKSLGISNFWRNLLTSISQDNRFKKVILLDRGNTPRFENIEVVSFPQFRNESEDVPLLTAFCNKHAVNLFISSYFTYPENCYNICLLHDFIPEKMGMNLNSDEWVSKMHGMAKANGYIGVSQTTLNDLLQLHPHYSHRARSVVFNSSSPEFKISSSKEIGSIKEKYGVTKKYFLIVGQRMSYKNTILFFKAFAELRNRDDFQIVCVGGYERVEYILRFYLQGFKHIIRINPDNSDLSALLSGAEALAYPSLYEGFGMPIIEAMASGCPIIISKQALACMEVGGEAVLTVDGFNVEEMKKALVEVQIPETRKKLIEAGFIKSKKYNSQNSLEQFYNAILDNIPQMNGSYGRNT